MVHGINRKHFSKMCFTKENANEQDTYAVITL